MGRLVEDILKKKFICRICIDSITKTEIKKERGWVKVEVNQRLLEK